MSQFMNLMYETMMCVEDKGEEQDLVSCLLCIMHFIIIIRVIRNYIGSCTNQQTIF